jgi:hypothetical protein
VAERKDLIEDLQRVDEEIDSVVDPNQYEFLGEFEFEEIIEEFGNWNTALEEAGISLKKKLVKDVLRVSEELDKSVSVGDYRETGNFRLSEIREEFGSWNGLKEAAGLEINTREVSLEELEKDMLEVADKLGRPISARDYDQHGKYSPGVLIQKDYTFAEFREKIGLENPKGRFSEEALKAWKEELKDEKGRFTLDELREKVEDSNFSLTKRGVADLRKYLKDSEFQFTRSKGGSRTKYYVEGPEAQTLEEYYQQFIERIPDDKENWFTAISGTGTSPKTIVAAIRYLTEEKNQKEIAKEEDVTEVSLRNAKSKIINRFDLESDAGRNISDENNPENDVDQEEREKNVIKYQNQKNEIETEPGINEEKYSGSKGTKDTRENVESEESELPSNLFFSDFLTLLNYEELTIDQDKEFPVIFALRNEKKILFLLELDHDKSGVDCIRAAEDLVSSSDVERAVVISNSFFKISARNWAESKEKIELWNRQNLAEKNESQKSIPEETPDEIKTS